MIVVYILLFILVLGIVVCIHEFGHFYFAKKAGILVNEFAFGMGPKLLSKKKGETYWSIRALPIGGFCAMSGEEVTDPLVKVGDEVKLVIENDIVTKIVLKTSNPDYSDLPVTKIEKLDLFGKDMSPLYINEYEVSRTCTIIISNKEEVQVAPEERNFFSKKVFERLLVVIGGPLNNILLSIFVFLIIGFISGGADTKTTNIGSVSTNSPAEVAGLKENDKIIKIGEYDINTYDEIGDAILNTRSRSVNIKVLRDEEELSFDVWANYYIQNLGFTSASNTDDKVIVLTEVESASGGTNKMLSYGDGKKEGLRNGDEVLSILYKKDKKSETYTEFIITSWEDVMDVAKNEIDGGYASIKFRRTIEGETKESMLF